MKKGRKELRLVFYKFAVMHQDIARPIANVTMRPFRLYRKSKTSKDISPNCGALGRLQYYFTIFFGFIGDWSIEFYPILSITDSRIIEKSEDMVIKYSIGC